VIAKNKTELAAQFGLQIIKIMGWEKNYLKESFINRQHFLHITKANYGSASAMTFALNGSPPRLPIYCELVADHTVDPYGLIIIDNKVIRPKYDESLSSKRFKVEKAICDFLSLYSELTD
jgi:hypothetical protein